MTGDSPGGWNTGVAGVAVTECAALETVWVEAQANGDVITGGQSSSFTGTLISLIT